MKSWIIVLLIGIGIFIAGFAIPINGTFGFGGMYVSVFGIILIIGAIIAAARRLMHHWKMISENFFNIFQKTILL